MATQWGRKESVVWPPHAPVYTYGAVMLALLCTGAFLWAAFAAETPLQQFYTPAYVKSAVAGQFKKQDKYRLLYLGDGHNQSRVATAADVAEGSTPTPDGKVLPLALSAKATAQGFRFSLSRTGSQLPEWASTQLFQERCLRGSWIRGHLWERALVRRPGALRHAPLFHLPRRETSQGDEVRAEAQRSADVQPEGIQQGSKRGRDRDPDCRRARLWCASPRRSEAQHIEIIGDTGSGKSTLLMGIMRQIADRKETAIVYDPACEFVQRFYDESRGDIILNPLDNRCPYWGPAEELRSKAEAKGDCRFALPTNQRQKG